MPRGGRRPGAGRPAKPPDEHAQKLSVSLRPVDWERLGALMLPDETPSEAMRRVLEWAYVMQIESK